MPAQRCPSCGIENPANARFCSECGKELRLSVATTPGPVFPGPSEGASISPPWQWPGPSASPPPPRGPGAFTPPPWRWIPDRRDIDRTRNGLIVLAAAALVGLIPLVGPFAYFVLGLVGAVIVFAARSFFGSLHRTNVNAAVVAWIIGFVVSIVGAVIAILVIAAAAPRGPGALQSALSTVIDIILVTTVIMEKVF